MPLVINEYHRNVKWLIKAYHKDGYPTMKNCYHSIYM